MKLLSALLVSSGLLASAQTQNALTPEKTIPMPKVVPHRGNQPAEIRVYTPN